VISDEIKIFLADTDPAEKVVLDMNIIGGSVTSKSPYNFPASKENFNK
jgi:hypothetical protein